MYVVRMKIEKIGSSDSVTYILVHFFVWNDFCTRAPMTVLRMPNGRVFLLDDTFQCYLPLVERTNSLHRTQNSCTMVVVVWPSILSTRSSRPSSALNQPQLITNQDHQSGTAKRGGSGSWIRPRRQVVGWWKRLVGCAVMLQAMAPLILQQHDDDEEDLLLAKTGLLVSQITTTTTTTVEESSRRNASSQSSTTTTTTTTTGLTSNGNGHDNGNMAVMLDVISIGSENQADLQQAQHDTIGTAVRHFYAATEQDDVESECHTSLTMDRVHDILNTCHGHHKQNNNKNKNKNKNQHNKFPILQALTQNFATIKWLQRKSNPTAWMCAQKRPVQALWNAVHHYYYYDNDDSDSQDSATHTPDEADHHTTTNNNQRRLAVLNASALPDYLIVGDDDMWINIPALHSTLPTWYPSQEPWAVAGCLFRMEPHHHNFTFPYGGYGLVLTRATLQHLLHPLTCPNLQQDGNKTKDTTTTTTIPPRQASLQSPLETNPTNDVDFEALACWRLRQNGIGERAFYQAGKSLLDIMYDYSVASPYLRQDWNNSSSTFCLHSDWVWGYLINYYHMAWHSNHSLYITQQQQQQELPPEYETVRRLVLHDRMQGYNGSTYLFRRGGRKQPHSNNNNNNINHKTMTVPYLGQCRHSNDFQHWLPKPKHPKPRWYSNHSNKNNNNSPSDAYCGMEAHFCHRISATHMRYLHHHHQQQQQQQQHQQQQQQTLP